MTVEMAARPQSARAVVGSRHKVHEWRFLAGSPRTPCLRSAKPASSRHETAKDRACASCMPLTNCLCFHDKLFTSNFSKCTLGQTRRLLVNLPIPPLVSLKVSPADGRNHRIMIIVEYYDQRWTSSLSERAIPESRVDGCVPDSGVTNVPASK